jgi:hypothetical protein
MIALFLRFFLIGILTIGGGLVAIPLLYQTFVVGEVISEALFYYMLSVSESTPGPIAINLATFSLFSGSDLSISEFTNDNADPQKATAAEYTSFPKPPSVVVVVSVDVAAVQATP